MELERYTSPDGELNLVVEQLGDDIIVSFGDYPWHTHADLMAPWYGPDQDAALRGFINEILSDRLCIVVSSLEGVVTDVEAEDDPSSVPQYGPKGEELLIRQWSGPLD
jgi:hypothetical protein